MSYINCSINTCQHGAECLTEGIEQICDCLPCFTGPACEQNLTTLVPIYAVWSDNLPKTKNGFFIGFQLFVIIILIDGLLCIQTILPSREIFITNLGIYLTVLSFSRIAVGIVLQIMILYHLNKFKQSKNYILFSVIFSCFYVSMWSNSCISIERMLIRIEYFDVQLYEKRRRSIITSIFVILFVFFTHFAIPGLIYLRRGQQYNNTLEILIRVVMLIHHSIPCILHLLASIVVLFTLVKHQREHRETFGWCYLIREQFIKHRDFFIQPVLYICCTLPFMVIFLTGIYIDDDCTQINRIFSQKYILPYISVIFFVPVLFAFPVLIWPNKIYMIQFHESSIVGKCYTNFKSRYRAYCCRNNPDNANNNEIEDTYL